MDYDGYTKGVWETVQQSNCTVRSVLGDGSQDPLVM